LASEQAVAHLLICLLICTSAFAQTDTPYPVYLISTPVVIDGKLDEDAWKGLIEATNFKILSQMKLTDKQTCFRVGWDREALYLGVKCHEPDISKVTAKEPDWGYVVREDSIEMFFDKEGRYDHLAVSTIGSRWVNGECTNWTAAAVRGKDFWAFEARIPFSELGSAPSHGETWRFNIARNATVLDSGGHKHTTWSPLQGTFHDVKRFRSLRFTKRRVEAERAARETLEFNEAVELGRLRELRDKAIAAIEKCRNELKDVEDATALSRFTRDISALDEMAGRGTDFEELKRTCDRAENVRKEILVHKLKALVR